jgi:hypothetical protein
MEIRDALNNTKKIYLSDSSLNMLLDFERVIDEMDLYSFENWIDGELVDGPHIERYWVECSFMWPRAKMPNPRGGARLIPYGCKVTYAKDTIKIPVKIESPDDFRTGTKQGKLVDVPVWIVTIRMPQELVSDIESGSLEIANEEYDLADIQSAYQQEIDTTAFEKQETNNDLVGDKDVA